jgi:predicted CopG family antitoxin
MAIIYNLNGNQYIKLYEIVLYFLEFKKYIVEDNLARKKNSQKQYEFSNLILNLFNEKKNSFTILLENLNDASLEELNNDIERMKSEDFEILNYRKVYSFFVKHVQTFIKKPESKFLKELFTKKNVIFGNEELEQKIKEEKINLYNEKLLKLIVVYENAKINIEEGSLSKNLGEKNILYNATYRCVLLRPMFHMINDKILFTKYRKQSLWHLFR